MIVIIIELDSISLCTSDAIHSAANCRTLNIKFNFVLNSKYRKMSQDILLLLLCLVCYICITKIGNDQNDQLCVGLKDEFVERNSKYLENCVEDENLEGRRAECSTHYLDVKEKYMELKLFLENKTCSDISNEQNAFEMAQKTWQRYSSSGL